MIFPEQKHLTTVDYSVKRTVQNVVRITVAKNVRMVHIEQLVVPNAQTAVRLMDATKTMVTVNVKRDLKVLVVTDARTVILEHFVTKSVASIVKPIHATGLLKSVRQDANQGLMVIRA